MHKTAVKLFLFAALTVGSLTAHALDFCSAAKHGAALYDTPSDKARKLLVVSRATPLEVLLEQAEWLRVRNQKGTIAWIKKQDTSPQRHLQVIKPGIVHKDARNNSDSVFRTETGLLLEMLTNTKTGWIKVKHRDGLTGYIRIEEVWGL